MPGWRPHRRPPRATERRGRPPGSGIARRSRSGRSAGRARRWSRSCAQRSGCFGDEAEADPARAVNAVHLAMMTAAVDWRPTTAEVTMNAFIIDLENRPGSLADTAAAIAEKGININGVAGATEWRLGTIALVTNDESATRSALAGHRLQVPRGRPRLGRARGQAGRAGRCGAHGWPMPASTSRRSSRPAWRATRSRSPSAVDNVDAAKQALSALTGATA